MLRSVLLFSIWFAHLSSYAQSDSFKLEFKIEGSVYIQSLNEGRQVELMDGKGEIHLSERENQIRLPKQTLTINWIEPELLKVTLAHEHQVRFYAEGSFQDVSIKSFFVKGDSEKLERIMQLQPVVILTEGANQKLIESLILEMQKPGYTPQMRQYVMSGLPVTMKQVENLNFAVEIESIIENRPSLASKLSYWGQKIVGEDINGRVKGDTVVFNRSGLIFWPQDPLYKAYIDSIQRLRERFAEFYNRGWTGGSQRGTQKVESINEVLRDHSNILPFPGAFRCQQIFRVQ